jgi:N-methylhydantoinase A
MFATTSVMMTDAFDYAAAAAILAELRSRAERFLAKAVAGAVSQEIGYSVEARYPNQVWEIEVPLRHGELTSGAQIADLCQDFHAAHEDLFAVRDKDAPVEIVTWRAHARCSLREYGLGSARPEPSARALPGVRRAFFPTIGTVETPVVAHDDLPVGEQRFGPLIVESPVTTVVLDERAAVERAPTGSLRLTPLLNGRTDE